MIEFVEGDMFETPADIRVNTVNCVGVMGAGVALAFKQRHPDMFRDYQQACRDGQMRPGHIHVWRSLTGDWIINFPTKRDWHDPSRYEDIDAGLDALRDYLKTVGQVTVAMPALGCGNGGLDWQRVSERIRIKLADVEARVHVYGPKTSRQAGGSPIEARSDGERREVASFGYQLSGARVGSSDAWAAGPAASRVISPWIAVLHGRSPGEREMQALSAIAHALVQQEPGATIALVHMSRASEEVAKVFADSGLETALLLPFGVLTRKPLAKLSRPGRGTALSLLSAAPPSAKWSRSLFAQTQEWLRADARAVLVSDPEPDWLLDRALAKWSSIPMSFVRYETTPNAILDALASAGAKAIGRRADNGAPNLSNLIGADLPAIASDDASTSSTATRRSGTTPLRDSETVVDASGAAAGSVRVTINLPIDPDEARRTLDRVLAAKPTRLIIEADLAPDSARTIGSLG